MQEKNVVTNSYLSDNRRFAQICNNALFGGRPLIQPEGLQSLDRTEALIRGRDATHVQTEEKFRDIVKIYRHDLVILIIGIENQSDISYAMPLRHLLYDALRYEAQYRSIAKDHRRKADLSGAEYLSRFSRTDRLIPVISLAVYWGEAPWDGPLTLKEILDIPEELEEYRDMINDYRVHLLDIRRMTDVEAYEGELKALLGFVKYQTSARELTAFIERNQDLFCDISLETLQAMAVLGNAEEVETFVLPGLKTREEKGTVNMNQALQEMMDEKWKQGIDEGIIKGIAKGKAEGVAETRADTAKRMFLLGFSPDVAASVINEEIDTVTSWFSQWAAEKKDGATD